MGVRSVRARHRTSSNSVRDSPNMPTGLVQGAVRPEDADHGGPHLVSAHDPEHQVLGDAVAARPGHEQLEHVDHRGRGAEVAMPTSVVRQTGLPGDVPLISPPQAERLPPTNRPDPVVPGDPAPYVDSRPVTGRSQFERGLLATPP